MRLPQQKALAKKFQPTKRFCQKHCRLQNSTLRSPQRIRPSRLPVTLNRCHLQCRRALPRVRWKSARQNPRCLKIRSTWSRTQLGPPTPQSGAKSNCDSMGPLASTRVPKSEPRAGHPRTVLRIPVQASQKQSNVRNQLRQRPGGLQGAHEYLDPKKGIWCLLRNASGSRHLQTPATRPFADLSFGNPRNPRHPLPNGKSRWRAKETN